MNNRSEIVLGEDGKYRWTYILNLKENSSILKTVMFILLFRLCVLLAIVVFTSIRNHATTEDMLVVVRVFSVLFCIILLIDLLSYFLISKIYGNKYIVIFEMDEKGVSRIQSEDTFSKTSKVARATAIAGLVNNDYALFGIGMMNSQRKGNYSKFDEVKRITADKKSNLIKVNSFMNHNKIYVNDEDYNFVLDYIINYCKNAHVKII